MTLPEAILMLLRSTRGEGRTLKELVHELTVLRANRREIPRVTHGGVLLVLEHLEAQRQVRRDGEQWFYAAVNEPVQGVLFR